jgi:hypothetical protein
MSTLVLAGSGWLGMLACSSSNAPVLNPPPDAADVRTADASGSDVTDAGLGPVNIPISVSEEATTDSMRFSVSIDVGASSLSVQLDTGSSGLRIIQGAVPDSVFTHVTSTAITYSYHSGLVIQGVVAYANVSLGSVHTAAPIPVMLIEEASCIASKPDCGAQGVPLSELTLFGPYKAILGVGMRSSAVSENVGSPIPQLEGEPAFVVMGPAYGGTEGTLRLRPLASQIAGLKTYDLPLLDGGTPLPNGVPAYDDRFGLPACLDDKTSGVDYCVPAELDTGNPPVYIEWPAHGDAGTTELPPGDDIDVTIGPSSSPLEQYSFKVGATPKPGVDEVLVESATGAGFMNLGTVVFFRYDVYFDQAHGVVGFGPH